MNQVNYLSLPTYYSGDHPALFMVQVNYPRLSEACFYTYSKKEHCQDRSNVVAIFKVKPKKVNVQVVDPIGVTVHDQIKVEGAA